MKLIRLATLYLHPFPEGFVPFGLRFQRVDVRILQAARLPDALRLLLVGEQELDTSLSISAEGIVSVPTDLRIAAEKVLEHFAHIISIREGSRWELRSPALCIALIPKTSEESESLASAIEVESSMESLGGVKAKINLTAESLSAALADRYDGAALLSEALSHERASAQFREYLRVFERAFTLTSTALVAPLSEFLIGANQGYSEAEVRKWLVEVRHPATHADVRDEFFLDADVRPIIFRVQQAAYDVLMNKVNWRDASPTRRNAWAPAAWTISPNSNTLETVEGNEPFQAQIQALDKFSVFPFDFQTEIRALLPADWWVEPPTRASDEKQGTYRLTSVSRDE